MRELALPVPEPTTDHEAILLVMQEVRYLRRDFDELRVALLGAASDTITSRVRALELKDIERDKQWFRLTLLLTAIVAAAGFIASLLASTISRVVEFGFMR